MEGENPMKKIISLILALALCLTAVSAFAAATPSKTAAAVALAESAKEIEVSEEAKEQGVTVDTAPASIKESEDLLNKLSDATKEENLDTIYDDVKIEDTREGKTEDADLSKFISILTAPVPVVTVAEEKQEAAKASEAVVEVSAPVEQAAVDYINGFETAPIAVYNYLKGNDLVSVIVDYKIVPAATPDGKPTLQYNIPLSVLADASGCPAFVNFVIEVK